MTTTDIETLADEFARLVMEKRAYAPQGTRPIQLNPDIFTAPIAAPPVEPGATNTSEGSGLSGMMSQLVDWYNTLGPEMKYALWGTLLGGVATGGVSAATGGNVARDIILGLLLGAATGAGISLAQQYFSGNFSLFGKVKSEIANVFNQGAGSGKPGINWGAGTAAGGGVAALGATGGIASHLNTKSKDIINSLRTGHGFDKNLGASKALFAGKDGYMALQKQRAAAMKKLQEIRGALNSDPKNVGLGSKLRAVKIELAQIGNKLDIAQTQLRSSLGSTFESLGKKHIGEQFANAGPLQRILGYFGKGKAYRTAEQLAANEASSVFRPFVNSGDFGRNLAKGLGNAAKNPVKQYAGKGLRGIARKLKGRGGGRLGKIMLGLGVLGAGVYAGWPSKEPTPAMQQPG